MKKINTEMIMVNLLKEDEERYCTIGKIQKLCVYVYQQLLEKDLLKNYSVKFSVDFESIERTILYNNKIFYLDIDGEVVYLREPYDVDSLIMDYEADNVITNLIREFNQLNVA